MRLILDKILWGALIVLFGPTVMIVASWNALPGDNLYDVKLAFEKTALTLASPSYATSGNLQIKYTERRFAEAKQLMASKQSIQGLPYLDQQIAQTKKAIESAPNKKAQIALAKQYITTLSTVSTNLEAQKQSITTTSPPSSQIPQIPQPTPTPQPTVQQSRTTSTPGAPTPTPTPTPVQIAQVATTTPISAGQAVAALQINQTQQNVSQTIADLQTLVDNDDRDQKGNRRKQEEEKGNKQDNSESKDNQDGKKRGKEPKGNDQ